MDEKKTEGSCCSGCGCGCGHGGKWMIGLLLLLVGGILGYLCGSHCGMRKMCPMGGSAMMMAPVSTPTK